ncbi:hypothetical protein Nepgr_024644 [Nepenthes gracilis]|uniref:Uncharacterized protein n=1 Tax=Nepenthes gracilis TaxID=150966 RepID=A0AAD3Y0Q2_NEPGR|nr:hypothetical protein Nepgr_024644 [Nepenthes gracilis]
MGLGVEEVFNFFLLEDLVHFQQILLIFLDTQMNEEKLLGSSYLRDKRTADRELLFYDSVMAFARDSSLQLV